jgi:hypothetical protein
MFDEWYTQTSFVESTPTSTTQKPTKPIQVAVRPPLPWPSVLTTQNDAVETEKNERKRRQAKKATVPVFEKPVIIRPKSTSDLRFLRKKAVREQGDLGWNPRGRELRVEQDLEADLSVKGLQDDRDFDEWTDAIQAQLENATLEKYMFASTSGRF